MLVEVAGDLFAADGFASTSLARVAEAGGVTKGALYHDFSDKLDLLEAVVVENQTRLAGHVDAVADDTLSAREWLDVGVGAYLSGCLDPKVRPWLLFVESPAALGARKWREIDESFFRDAVLAGVTEVLAGNATIAPDVLCDVLYAYLTDSAVRSATSGEPEAVVEQTRRGVTALIDAVTTNR